MIVNQQSRGPSRRIINILGVVGYSLLIPTYAIVAGLSLIWLTEMGSLSIIGVAPDMLQSSSSEATAATDQPNPSLLVTIVTYAITAFMTVTVLFVMITLPYWLGKSGSYIIKRTIRFCQWPVTPTSLFLAKTIACAIAVVPALIMSAQNIDNLVVSATALIVLGSAFMSFLLQHYLAKISRLDAKDIW